MGDRGVFIIEYLSHIFQKPSALAGLGLSPHRHWFDQDRVSHRRQRLRWIAHKLIDQARAKSEPDVARLLRDVQGLRQQVSAALTDLPKEAPCAKRLRTRSAV